MLRLLEGLDIFRPRRDVGVQIPVVGERRVGRRQVGGWGVAQNQTGWTGALVEEVKSAFVFENAFEKIQVRFAVLDETVMDCIRQGKALADGAAGIVRIDCHRHRRRRLGLVDLVIRCQRQLGQRRFEAKRVKQTCGIRRWVRLRGRSRTPSLPSATGIGCDLFSFSYS